MATQVQFRGGSTTEHSTFTGAAREVTVDTTKNVAVVHDGSTAGGHPMMAEDGSNSALALGSAGTPALKFTDTNTGIYSPGADQIALSTGGTGRLFIDSSGNVGINTSSPSSKLHVDHDINAEAYTIIENSRNYGFGVGIDFKQPFANAGSSIVGGRIRSDYESDNNSFFAFSTLQSGTLGEKLRIDSAGRVGIGETSMDALLVIKGNSDANTTPSIRLKDGTDTREAWITNTSGDLILSNGGNDNVPHCYLKMFDGNVMAFATANTERMRIDSSGRLLVGTTSAVAPDGTNYPAFQVNRPQSGGLNASALIREVEASTSWPKLYINKNRANNPMQTDNKLGSVDYYGDTGSSDKLGARVEATAEGTWTTSSHPTRLVFSSTASGASSPTEHFRIASNGDLTATDTTIGSNSDSRLKTNVADFTYDLEDFKQYQPKTFDWKNPELHGNKAGQRGFIAQDVEAIDSYWVDEQAVDEGSADAEFLDADRLAKTLKLGKKDAMYVSVIQQLLSKIETLETKVAALEAG